MGPHRGVGSAASTGRIYSYLPSIFKLVQDGASADAIAQHLTDIVVNRMGLNGTIKDSLEVVSVLQDWKEALDEKYDGR
jgi:hypothetical protein